MKSLEHDKTKSRVTIAEAAKMLGLSQTKIRGWLDESGFATRNEQGWWQIDRVALLAKAAEESSQKGSLRVGAMTSQRVSSHNVGVSQSSQREVADERVRDLLESLQRERRINDELRAQMHDLQAAQTQHLAELRALLENNGKEKGILSRWIRT